MISFQWTEIKALGSREARGDEESNAPMSPFFTLNGVCRFVYVPPGFVFPATGRSRVLQALNVIVEPRRSLSFGL